MKRYFVLKWKPTGRSPYYLLDRAKDSDTLTYKRLLSSPEEFDVAFETDDREVAVKKVMFLHNARSLLK
jgi:hypothetical protein